MGADHLHAGSAVEIEEAAIVDGATPWIIITKVFLPLMWPATGDDRAACLYRGVERVPVRTYLHLLEPTRAPCRSPSRCCRAAAQHEIPWGTIMAASVIVTVPLVVLVLIFQRKIISGLTAGGVKG